MAKNLEKTNPRIKKGLEMQFTLFLPLILFCAYAHTLAVNYVKHPALEWMLGLVQQHAVLTSEFEYIARWLSWTELFILSQHWQQRLSNYPMQSYSSSFKLFSLYFRLSTCKRHSHDLYWLVKTSSSCFSVLMTRSLHHIKNRAGIDWRTDKLSFFEALKKI